MRIDNRTKWRTEDLRFMIGQALRERGVPSEGVEVTITLGRREEPGGIAGKGHFVTELVRTVGASHKRGPVTVKFGRSMWCAIRNPAKDFDASSEEHVAFVVELARMFDYLAAIMAAKKPAKDWRERPIAWLSDWFEVNRGANGRLAGCPVSPLLPKVVTLEAKAAREAKKLEHALAMFAKARTRAKRASTLEKKWARRVAALERKVGK